MSLGTLGIIVELWNPGLIFPGTVGAISLDPRALRAPGAADQRGRPPADDPRLRASSPPRRSSRRHGAITLAGAVCFVIGALLLFEPAGRRLPGLAARRARDRRHARGAAWRSSPSRSSRCAERAGRDRARASSSARPESSGRRSPRTGSSSSAESSGRPAPTASRSPPGTPGAGRPDRRRARARGRAALST